MEPDESEDECNDDGEEAKVVQWPQGLKVLVMELVSVVMNLQNLGLTSFFTDLVIRCTIKDNLVLLTMMFSSEVGKYPQILVRWPRKAIKCREERNDFVDDFPLFI